MNQKTIRSSLCFAVSKSFCLAIILSFFSIQFLYAQNSSTYSVNDIAITAKGKTPTQARINATEQAQRSAFITLLGRLSWEEKYADNLSNEEISDMVMSQEIINEKIAGNTYYASFNITFSPSYVTSALGNKNIAETREENYLVFPVKITKAKSLLWENENDWRMLWEKALKEKNETRLKLPSGNIDDITAINPEIIATGNYKEFESIINKYKTDAVIIAYYDYDELENKVNITLKTVRKFQNKETKLGMVNINHLEYAELMSKVTGKTIEHIIKSKPAASEGLTSKTPVNIIIPINDLGEWMAIKNKLQAVDFIKEMKVDSVARDSVRISIIYDRSNGDIIKQFAKYNFNVKEKSEGQYILTPGF
jgi:hypothetical protein